MPRLAEFYVWKWMEYRHIWRKILSLPCVWNSSQINTPFLMRLLVPYRSTAYHWDCLHSTVNGEEQVEQTHGVKHLPRPSLCYVICYVFRTPSGIKSRILQNFNRECTEWIQTLRKWSSDPLDIYSVTIIRGKATRNDLTLDEVRIEGKAVNEFNNIKSISNQWWCSKFFDASLLTFCNHSFKTDNIWVVELSHYWCF
jgi:hypothetical protein